MKMFVILAGALPPPPPPQVLQLLLPLDLAFTALDPALALVLVLLPLVMSLRIIAVGRSHHPYCLHLRVVLRSLV